MMEVLIVLFCLVVGISVFAIADEKRYQLEAKIRKGYNPDAVDGDGDGKIQDGTEWERPAPKKAVKKAVKKTVKKAPAKKKSAKKATTKKKVAKKKK